MAYTNINKSSSYFNTKLYDGNASTNAITGVGFQPDFTWVKKRTTGNEHTVADVVRGSTKVLYTNLDIVEGTNTSGITSFNSDGFTIGGASGDYNDNGVGYASWNWKGGGTGVSNTDGSITTTVSANTTSGFSIVTWNGSSTTGTIGHGLGAKPAMIITKSRSDAGSNWVTWHKGLGTSNEQRNLIYLNLTNAKVTSGADLWGTTINSSTFGVLSGGYDNNKNSMVAYCFAEKKGFSQFGSYIGNGNNDGIFVYTGFKPAFVITKSTGVGVWNLLDNKRNGYNVTHLNLQPHNSNGEDTGRDIDFLSNGFKLRNGGTEMNASGSTYIYMCFAEHPLVSSTGTPCTAR